MKSIGISEAKTELSEICEAAAESGEPVTVTGRGRPLVRIGPIPAEPASIIERREAYLAEYGPDEDEDDTDFEVPRRSREVMDFATEDWTTL